MANPKLLIVEDDEDLCSQYRWAFPGFDVVIAQSRAQALAAVRKDAPPVALMDLGLPPDPDGVSEGFATLDDTRSPEAEDSWLTTSAIGRQTPPFCSQ